MIYSNQRSEKQTCEHDAGQEDRGWPQIEREREREEGRERDRQKEREREREREREKMINKQPQGSEPWTDYETMGPWAWTGPPPLCACFIRSETETSKRTERTYVSVV